MKHFAAAALALSMLPPVAAAEPELQISRAGTRTANSAPAQNFTGSVRVEMLYTPAGPERTSAGSVSFAAGARTAWHTHPLGQTLIVTAGVGRVQRLGGPIEEIKAGDVVHIPPGMKHWHGAAPTSAMTHIAITEALDGKAVDWLEQVSDAQYGAPQAAAAAGPAQPSQAQRLLGDVVPKLAQLTDDVLFGDVWVRSGLSPRDRSLVTVSALIAMNRPDQLRSHMSRALDNGLSKDELAEALTHLAFYAGWPNAVTATGVAREVFATRP
ncbi:4-carboxymuconolactone decarboxylase [Variovorax sp. YR266]|uniref:(R)-mandelonitrile lyase n=1 Tax=Variovorax sp. YR266 TaxID=1884386 RepID=UPI00089BA4A0|nr:carboxymuconolactone decarboxylase family protein [Variovorax sp. YR266]SDY30898.1 4-carboxymuconolactone decarboxylase [Variovorax sp. YR266]